MSQTQRGNKSDPLAAMRTSEARTDRGQKKRATPLIETDAKPGRGQPTKPKKVEKPLEPFDWKKPSFALAMQHLKLQMRSRAARGMYIAAFAHFVLIIALGLMVTNTPAKGDGIMLASSMSEPVQDVTVDTVMQPPQMQVEEVAVMETMAAPTAIAAPIAMGQLAGDTYVPDVKVGGEGLSVEGLLTEIGVGDGVGKGGEEKPKPAPKKAAPSMFFGSSTTGERIAFVIDKSTSSPAAVYDAARFQLLQTVSSFKPYNKFYVVFFSADTLPMFSPEVEKDMLPATPQNINKLGQWMASIPRLKGGTGLNGAFDQCVAQKPDVIYFLTDGLMGSSYLDHICSVCVSAKIPVNTIGFKAQFGDPQEGARNLQEIAKRTNGNFLFIQ